MAVLTALAFTPTPLTSRRPTMRRPLRSMCLLPLAATALLGSGAAVAQARTPRLPPVYHIWSIRGVDLDVGFTNEWYSLVKGGLDEGTDTLTNVDFVLNIDTAESLLWQNGRFMLYVLGNNGSKPSQRTGDLQYASNLEAVDTIKLQEAWYEHTLPEWQSSLLLGMHDLNRDFYVLNYGNLFFNSSFAIGADITQVSLSTFPFSSLGIRYSFMPEGGQYLHVAMYDGVPGDPEHPGSAHVQFNPGDGAFTIVEGGLITDEKRYAKLGFGAWHHTAEYADFSDTVRDDNMGAYVIAESELWQSRRAFHVGGFVQMGFAKEDRNQVARYAGAGLNFFGMIPSRPNDVAGIAVAQARNGDHIMAFDTTLVRAETAIEVSYLFSPLSWLILQPDLQYIVDPGGNVETKDAVVASMRMELAF